MDSNHQDINAEVPLTDKSKSNILLIGTSGAGKSVIGHKLAMVLGLGFLDSDQWIEHKQKLSINEIFSKHGETYFREQEIKLLNFMSGINNHVISLGGGVNAEALKKSGLLQKSLCVWIEADPQKVTNRLTADTYNISSRPVIKNAISNSIDRDEIAAKLKEYLIKLNQDKAEMISLSEVKYSNNDSNIDISVLQIRSLVANKLNDFKGA